MDRDNEMISRALSAGFCAAKILPSGAVPIDFSFLRYCEENLCLQYDANYSCPPLCGTPKEMADRLLSYEKVLVVQSKWPIRGKLSYENYAGLKPKHNRWMLPLVESFRKDGIDGLMGGAGCCDLCDRCKRKDGLPCAHPELRFSCLSAYNINVKELAALCGMDYDWNEETLYLFGFYAFGRGPVCRRAKPSEYDALGELAGEIFSTEQGIPKELTPLAKERRPLWWVIEQDGNILGCVAAFEEDGRQHMGRFVILPEYRDRHLGSRLVRFAIDDLFSTGVTETFMEVRETTAHILKKLGAKETGDPFDLFGTPCLPMSLSRDDYCAAIAAEKKVL